jgi:hypothetical protein
MKSNITNEAMQEQSTLPMEVKRKPKGTETEPTIVDQMRDTRDTTGEQRTKGESVRRKQQIKVVLGKGTSESALRSAKRLVVGSAAKFCGQVAQGSIPFTPFLRFRAEREREKRERSSRDLVT